MQINIDGYYLVQTPQGQRIAKVLQYDSTGIPYGIYSVSEFQNPKDGQGIQIPGAIRSATNQEQQDWEVWYAS